MQIPSLKSFNQECEVCVCVGGVRLHIVGWGQVFSASIKPLEFNYNCHPALEGLPVPIPSLIPSLFSAFVPCL